jgi:hypothetical protein
MKMIMILMMPHITTVCDDDESGSILANVFAEGPLKR